MGKRLFDVVMSLVGLAALCPLMALIAILVKLDSHGPVFYRQVRVGRGGVDFRIFKFRTMRVNADRAGLITVGGRDPRVTRVGYHLRRFKLDELPQLLNVFVGDMSLVGPRPEVRKYVDLYTQEQREVLTVRPGITDLASLRYRGENELLGKAADPEAFYVEEVMPAKLALNLKYIRNRTFWGDIGLIIRTLLSIWR